MYPRLRTTVEYGDKIKKWGGWYRHDTYFLAGQKLEGFVQQRTNGRGGHETTTCFRNSCVLGRDVEWLIRMNIEEGKYQVPEAPERA